MKKFVLALCLGLSPVAMAQGTTLGVGLTAMEGGDDRQLDGLNLAFTKDELSYEAFYFQRRIGPARERTALVGVIKDLGFPFKKNGFVGLGLVGMSESTDVAYSKDADKKFNQSQTQYNFGMLAAVKYSFELKAGYDLVAAWETAVFPAGLAGLFLATGRKQLLSLSFVTDL